MNKFNILLVFVVLVGYSQLGFSQSQNAEAVEQELLIEGVQNISLLHVSPILTESADFVFNIIEGFSFDSDEERLLRPRSFEDMTDPPPHYAKMLIRHASMDYDEREEISLILENRYPGLLVSANHPDHHPDLSDLVTTTRQADEIRDDLCGWCIPALNPVVYWASLSYFERKNSHEPQITDFEDQVDQGYLLEFTRRKDRLIEELTNRYGWMMDEDLERFDSQVRSRGYRSPLIHAH